MTRTWTTAEVVRREPTRTLWRVTTWRAGIKGEQREEWRPVTKEDGE